MSAPLLWTTDPNVLSTVVEDSFGGWEHAFAEAVKNAFDADATRVDITLPPRAAMLAPDEERVVIEDNGRGMSQEEIQEKYCRIGRPKLFHDGSRSPGGRRYLGRRGTGKMASLAVVKRARVETWTRGGSRSWTEFSSDLFLQQDRNNFGIFRTDYLQAWVTSEPNQNPSSGTRLTLEDFLPDAQPPTMRLVHSILLRHFCHINDIEFYINGERFRTSDLAELAQEFDDEEVGELGRVSGQIWVARQTLNTPGIIVCSGGQTIYGPGLMGIEHKGYRGEPKKVIGRLLGNVEVSPYEHGPMNSGLWTMTRGFAALEEWIGSKLTDVVEKQTRAVIEGKVEKFLQDPPARKIFRELGDAEKAAARQIIRKRAERMGESAQNQASEKLITRLVLRSLKMSGLDAVLEALDEASDQTVDALGEILAGDDPWTLRQVVTAASLVKQRTRALDELESCVADYDKHEADIHKILNDKFPKS